MQSFVRSSIGWPLALVFLGAAPAAAEWPPSPETVALVMEAEAQELAEAAVEAEGGTAPDLLAALDSAIAADARNAEALNQRGLFRLELGERQTALADFTRAVRLAPGELAYVYNQGLAQELLGALSLAQRAYRRAQLAGPDSETGIAAWWGLEALRTRPPRAQANLLSRMGAPDSFTVAVSAPDGDADRLVRVEEWEYWRAGKAYSFVNGEQTETRDIARASGMVSYPLDRPYMFENGMPFLDAANAAGFDEYGFIEYDEPGLAGVDLVVVEQLVLGFLDDRLFYAHSIPLRLAAFGPPLSPETLPAAVTEPAAPAPAEPGPAVAAPVEAPAPAAEPAPAAQPAAAGDVVQRLETLERLHDQGLITDEEYRAKRQAILDEL
jgi:hypothetical protein